MHRVLSIPEILMEIFRSLESDSNARNARVCRQWTDPALDETWRVAEPDLFRSLAPMRDRSTSGPLRTLVRTLSSLMIIKSDQLFVDVCHRAHCGPMGAISSELKAGPMLHQLATEIRLYPFSRRRF